MTTDQVDARHVLATSLVTGLDHVGIAVADLDAAIEWYHDHLGMILVHEEVNEDQGIREAMVAVPGAPDSAQIQLMAPLNESSTIAKFLDKRGPGIQQLACRVSDLDALSQRLRAQGVRLIYDAPRRGTANSRINFIHPKDAGGVLIELVEQACGTRRTSSTFGSDRASRAWPSTACANAAGPPSHPVIQLATPPRAPCRNGFGDRSPDSDKS